MDSLALPFFPHSPTGDFSLLVDSCLATPAPRLLHPDFTAFTSTVDMSDVAPESLFRLDVSSDRPWEHSVARGGSEEDVGDVDDDGSLSYPRGPQRSSPLADVQIDTQPISIPGYYDQAEGVIHHNHDDDSDDDDDDDDAESVASTSSGSTEFTPPRHWNSLPRRSIDSSGDDEPAQAAHYPHPPLHIGLRRRPYASGSGHSDVHHNHTARGLDSRTTLYRMDRDSVFSGLRLQRPTSASSSAPMLPPLGTSGEIYTDEENEVEVGDTPMSSTTPDYIGDALEQSQARPGGSSSESNALNSSVPSASASPGSSKRPYEEATSLGNRDADQVHPSSSSSASASSRDPTAHGSAGPTSLAEPSRHKRHRTSEDAAMASSLASFSTSPMRSSAGPSRPAGMLSSGSSTVGVTSNLGAVAGRQTAEAQSGPVDTEQSDSSVEEDFAAAVLNSPPFRGSEADSQRPGSQQPSDYASSASVQSHGSASSSGARGSLARLASPTSSGRTSSTRRLRQIGTQLRDCQDTLSRLRESFPAENASSSPRSQSRSAYRDVIHGLDSSLTHLQQSLQSLEVATTAVQSANEATAVSTTRWSLPDRCVRAVERFSRNLRNEDFRRALDLSRSAPLSTGLSSPVGASQTTAPATRPRDNVGQMQSSVADASAPRPRHTANQGPSSRLDHGHPRAARSGDTSTTTPGPRIRGSAHPSSPARAAVSASVDPENMIPPLNLHVGPEVASYPIYLDEPLPRQSSTVRQGLERPRDLAAIASEERPRARWQSRSPNSQDEPEREFRESLRRVGISTRARDHSDPARNLPRGFTDEGEDTREEVNYRNGSLSGLEQSHWSSSTMEALALNRPLASLSNGTSAFPSAGHRPAEQARGVSVEAAGGTSANVITLPSVRSTTPLPLPFDGQQRTAEASDCDRGPPVLLERPEPQGESSGRRASQATSDEAPPSSSSLRTEAVGVLDAIRVRRNRRDAQSSTSDRRRAAATNEHAPLEPSPPSRGDQAPLSVPSTDRGQPATHAPSVTSRSSTSDEEMEELPGWYTEIFRRRAERVSNGRDTTRSRHTGFVPILGNAGAWSPFDDRRDRFHNPFLDNLWPRLDVALRGQLASTPHAKPRLRRLTFAELRKEHDAQKAAAASAAIAAAVAEKKAKQSSSKGKSPEVLDYLFEDGEIDAGIFAGQPEYLVRGSCSSSPPPVSPYREASPSDSNDGPENCTICLEEYVAESKLVRTDCEHVFHEECCLQWVRSKSNCPMCRQPIEALPLEEAPPSVSSNHSTNADVMEEISASELSNAEWLTRHLTAALHGPERATTMR